MKEIKQLPLDKILKALGDPVRLGVIKQLLSCENQEITCGDFDYCVQKATFSHHIKILLESHILCERVEGVRKYLSINPQIKKAYPDILKTISSN
jgi:DNA-binding transcriptional ArsR family regulator